MFHKNWTKNLSFDFIYWLCYDFIILSVLVRTRNPFILQGRSGGQPILLGSIINQIIIAIWYKFYF